MRRAIIVDLDGTICDHDHRMCHADRPVWGPVEYADFYRHVELDKPIRPILELVHQLKHLGYHVLFMTGRPEEYRYETEKWLTNQGFGSYSHPIQLWMRPTNDFTCDTIIKKNFYLTKIKDNYEVKYILEDRNKVVKMWRELGLTCLQVQEGNF